MRLASLNSNKRLGSDAARTRVEQWLSDNHADLFVAQEAWKPPDREPPTLHGFRAVGGTHLSFAWIRDDLPVPKLSVNAPHWITLNIEGLAIHSLYLDAYKQSTRAAQINEIGIQLASDAHPTIIVGDFNIAPSPSDGLTDGEPSRFNSETDRAPLRALLADLGLIDLGAGVPVHFTIERFTKRASTRFRCDLALSSRSLADELDFVTDDVPRTDRFSDHSALIVDIPSLPVPARARPAAPKQLSLLPEQARGIATHKTAMGRSAPSAPAVRLARPLIRALRVGTVLDFGCGRGRDVAYYRDELGLDAHGYDPHEAFGFLELPERGFDLVTVVFVLNVIHSPNQRVEALQTASLRLAPSGTMLLVTRSVAEIESHARQRGWSPWGDGYISDPRKDTFQRGFTPNELLGLGHQVGLVGLDVSGVDLPTLPQASYAVLTHAQSG